MSLSPSLQNGRISLAFSEFGELLNSTNSFLFINHNLLGTEVSSRRLRCFYWKLSRKEILSAHTICSLLGCLVVYMAVVYLVVYCRLRGYGLLDGTSPYLFPKTFEINTVLIRLLFEFR